ncbi:hypothetical protein [Polaromonas sp.]|uniref:hypothetical protein n=1 Tax=Polaromonas sp. TaxID=1869339 RepID=UPI002730DB79|nr:hypothetical protein [Polaromonas sp.]MDP1742932.1 hypothetical protein [Polaromonas sp.]
MKFTNEFCGRFYFAFDMNGDGLTTISDIWMLFKNLFLIPSKAIAELIAHLPKLASFFEMDCWTGDGGGGAIFSALVWFVIFVTTVDAVQNSSRN